MARCEDCLHFDLCEAFERHNGLTKVESTLCGFYKPTADVAPREEVAREIIDAFEDLLDRLFFDDGYNICDFEKDIAKLKKKYTEGRNER